MYTKGNKKIKTFHCKNSTQETLMQNVNGLNSPIKRNWQNRLKKT